MIKSIYRFISPKFQNLFLDYPVKFEPRYGHGKPPHNELYSIINKQRAEYEIFLNNTLQFKESIQRIEKTVPPDNNVPYWNNGFLPGLDIIVLYSMLAQKKAPQIYRSGIRQFHKSCF